jgi:hypothetical protein
MICSKSFKLIGILLILFISCTNKNQEPNAGKCKSVFIASPISINNSKDNALNISYKNDTFNYNQAANFNQAIAILKSKFNAFDKLNEHEATKIYLKSLLLSEFVYAASSFQFFGSMHGKSSHDIAFKNWNKLPLTICYHIANNNLQPLWCGDRTTFYIRLLDYLLGIKATEVSIQNVHTFPIVNIGDKRFIFDPYDPFIVFDSSLTRIIDYDELLENAKKNNNLTVLRTKKTFGFANELVSNDLAFAVLCHQNKNNNDFSKKLRNYIHANKAKLLQGVNKCSFETIDRKWIIYPANLKYDKYVIRVIDNLNNAPMNLNHFRKYYLDINCK